MFFSPPEQKYEKKQISQSERQHGECTALKCYLGFGYWGLGGFLGKKERGRGSERERHTIYTHIYTEGSASADHETLSVSCPLKELLIEFLWRGFCGPIYWRSCFSSLTVLRLSDCSYSYTQFEWAWQSSQSHKSQSMTILFILHHMHSLKPERILLTRWFISTNCPQSFSKPGSHICSDRYLSVEQIFINIISSWLFVLLK